MSDFTNLTSLTRLQKPFFAQFYRRNKIQGFENTGNSRPRLRNEITDAQRTL